MKTIAYHVNTFLRPSEGFIYDQIINIKNYDVEVLTRKYQNRTIFPFENVNAIKSGHNGGGKIDFLNYTLFRNSRYFDSIIKNKKIALLHSHFGTEGVYAIPFKERFKLPLIVTFHGHDITRLPKFTLFPPAWLKYWLNFKDLAEKGVVLTNEARVPCRALKPSKRISFVPPPAWYGFCKRRTSWYWDSEKAGKTLVVSDTALDHPYLETVTVIKGSNFKPERFPPPDDLTRLAGSEAFQTKKPHTWDNVDPDEKEFYRVWFEHYRPDDVFDFDKIFVSHSANHANFLDPRYFIRSDGLVIPYSIGDSVRVCSSCAELFNILGTQWTVKYVIPCIGAVQFAHLPMDQYLEVTTSNR